MSVVTSSHPFHTIRLPNTSSTTQQQSSCTLKFIVRSSQAEGPLRRPVTPSPVKPLPPSPKQQQSVVPSVAVEQEKGGLVITLEFQRQKAKELQEYFKKKKLQEEADKGPAFGFVPKNEISNGRWAMFGFAVGMLTEYATGSDFVDQVKILLSNFGIVDLE